MKLCRCALSIQTQEQLKPEQAHRAVTMNNDACHFGGCATSARQCARHLFFGTLQHGPESSGAERRPGSWGCKAAESPAQSCLLPGCMALTPLGAAHSPCKHMTSYLAPYCHSFGARKCSHNDTTVSKGIKRDGRKVLTVYRRTSTLDICACMKHTFCLLTDCIAGACKVVPEPRGEYVMHLLISTLLAKG